MTDETPPDSIAANIAEWSETNAQWTDAQAERVWETRALTWGVFNVREDAIGSPLGDVDRKDVVELGCGTAYCSAQLARRGARPVGVDPTPAQLDTARRMMERTGIRFPLVEAPGERVCCLTPPSIWRSRSSAPRCGPIRRSGCWRPRACCGPAGVSSS